MIGGPWMRPASSIVNPECTSQALEAGIAAQIADPDVVALGAHALDERVLARGVHQLGHGAAPAVRVAEVRHARGREIDVVAELAARAEVAQHADQAHALAALGCVEHRDVGLLQLCDDLGVVRLQALDLGLFRQNENARHVVRRAGRSEGDD